MLYARAFCVCFQNPRLRQNDIGVAIGLAVWDVDVKLKETVAHNGTANSNTPKGLCPCAAGGGEGHPKKTHLQCGSEERYLLSKVSELEICLEADETSTRFLRRQHSGCFLHRSEAARLPSFLLVIRDDDGSAAKRSSNGADLSFPAHFFAVLIFQSKRIFSTSNR